jgi:hypothetical protein
LNKQIEVYVVVQEDRGMGTYVVGVYFTEDQAKDVVASGAHRFYSKEIVTP